MIKVGDRVQVVALTDETALPENLYKTGTVFYLGVPTDIGATEDDPFIGVSFDHGGADNFWTEELMVLPSGITNTEAPGL